MKLKNKNAKVDSLPGTITVVSDSAESASAGHRAASVRIFEFVVIFIRSNIHKIGHVRHLLIISYTKNGTENEQQKRPKSYDPDLQLGYKDSNLEMTESESVALPFGDSPLFAAN